MEIGKRIQKYRKLAGLTQRELAEKLGVVTGTVQQYELGKRHPRLDQLQRIADVLGVKVHELYSDKQEHQEWISSVSAMISSANEQRIDKEFVDYWNGSELEKRIDDNFNPFYREWIDRVGEIDEKYGKRLEEVMKEGYKLGYMAAQGLKPKNVETLVAAGIDEREAEFLLHFSNSPSEEQKLLLNVMERIHKQSMNTDKED